MKKRREEGKDRGSEGGRGRERKREGRKDQDREYPDDHRIKNAHLKTRYRHPSKRVSTMTE